MEAKDNMILAFLLFFVLMSISVFLLNAKNTKKIKVKVSG